MADPLPADFDVQIHEPHEIAAAASALRLGGFIGDKPNCIWESENMLRFDTSWVAQQAEWLLLQAERVESDWDVLAPLRDTVSRLLRFDRLVDEITRPVAAPEGDD